MYIVYLAKLENHKTASSQPFLCSINKHLRSYDETADFIASNYGMLADLEIMWFAVQNPKGRKKSCKSQMPQYKSIEDKWGDIFLTVHRSHKENKTNNLIIN